MAKRKFSKRESRQKVSEAQIMMKLNQVSLVILPGHHRALPWGLLSPDSFNRHPPQETRVWSQISWPRAHRVMSWIALAPYIASTSIMVCTCLRSERFTATSFDRHLQSFFLPPIINAYVWSFPVFKGRTCYSFHFLLKLFLSKIASQHRNMVQLFRNSH